MPALLLRRAPLGLALLAACAAPDALAPVTKDGPGMPVALARASAYDQFNASYCPSADPQCFPIVIGGGSDQRLAQTFTVGISGRLDAVQFPFVACTPDARGRLRLRVTINNVNPDGTPGTTVLSRTGVTALPPAVDPGTTQGRIALAHDVRVSAGDVRSVVLTMVRGVCTLNQSVAGDRYPSGHGFFDAVENRPFRPWVGFGETQIYDDLAFYTEVR
jgi:hypothetical protein